VLRLGDTNAVHVSFDETGEVIAQDERRDSAHRSPPHGIRNVLNISTGGNGRIRRAFPSLPKSPLVLGTGRGVRDIVSRHGVGA